MDTLYLHIGTHKTATTTIQHFMAANDDVLNTKGYTYPKFPFHYPFKSQDRNGLFLGTPYLDGNGVRQKEVEEKNLKKGMEILHDTFKTYHNIVISNERLWQDLYSSDASLMKMLVDDAKAFGYRIKMIVYLRRQDKFVESYWNEQIKSNIYETRSLVEYIPSFKFLDYDEIFSTLGDLVGDENMVIRSFDEIVRGEGMLVDFMKQIDLELTDEYRIPDEQSNERLTGNSLEIKRVINGLEGLKKVDMTYLRESLYMCSETSGKRYPYSELSVEERTELMKPYEEGNAHLAERFIGDGKPLFSLDYSGLPKRTDTDPEFLNDVIRASAAGDVVLLRRLKEDEKLIKALEKKIDKLEAANEKLNEKISKQSVRIDHLRHPIRAIFFKK